jgi:SagB-type dehydrogenase family enzyme
VQDRDGARTHPLATAGIYTNAFKPIAPWVQSTGFRTHGLRHRALVTTDDSRVAEDFLVNSRLRRNDRESQASIQSYFFDANIVMLSMLGAGEDQGCPSVALPPSAPLRMELGEAISWRRSARVYSGDAMALEDLAAIVRSAAGSTGQAEVDLAGGERCTFRLRATPSAGGLYPIDVYAVAVNVTGLARAIYRYAPITDTLLRTGDEPALERLLQCFEVPDELISLGRANVVFLLVGRPWKTMRKYGARGMRFLFLEAGAITQHINLAAVAAGFGSVECGSVYDDEVHEVLQLDGVYEAVLHSVVVGAPA